MSLRWLGSLINFLYHLHSNFYLNLSLRLISAVRAGKLTHPSPTHLSLHAKLFHCTAWINFHGDYRYKENQFTDGFIIRNQIVTNPAPFSINCTHSKTFCTFIAHERNVWTEYYENTQRIQPSSVLLTLFYYLINIETNYPSFVIDSRRRNSQIYLWYYISVSKLF